MKPDAAREAAEILWSARLEGRRLEALPAGCRPATVADGYAVQQAMTALSGQAIVGWKIAATSAAGQKHIGVSEPLGGPLFARFMLGAGAAIEVAPLHMRVAEAEFAFRMGRALPPRTRPYALDEVMAAVSDLHLAIEVPDSRFERFETIGAPSLIADDACAGWFVLGPRVADWRGDDLAAQPVTVVVNGSAAATGRGANVLGDPRIALAWMANEMSRHGLELAPGQLVMTGTCITPLPLAPGIRVAAEFGGYGCVEAAFA